MAPKWTNFLRKTIKYLNIAKTKTCSAKMGDSLEDISVAKHIVHILYQKGIRLLALDFDKTLISIHTSGYWKGAAAKLAEHVRPCFQMLIKAALEYKLPVCIVTYSMQPDVIKDVLHLVLPKVYVQHISFLHLQTWYTLCLVYSYDIVLKGLIYSNFSIVNTCAQHFLQHM